MFNNSPNRPPFRPTPKFRTESLSMEITPQPLHYPSLAQSSHLTQPRFTSSHSASSTHNFSPFSTSLGLGGEVHHNIDPVAGRSTLWMGELEPWMDEGALRQIWASVGFSVMPKVIHHRGTGQSAGYGFVEFARPTEAQRALTTLQGTPLPGTRKVFRLNWALGVDTFPSSLRDASTPEFSIFVGDLADGVDDAALLGLFRQYPSARAAKVVLDAGTGRHRGYGFVRFGSEADRARALVEMPGTLLQGRPVRVSLATPRARPGSSPPSENRSLSALGIGYVDPSITTVFVGNLDPNAGEEDLRK
ncbi:hypothetical protein DSO57_1003447 [Entomophthora muscae]|uniref:Uncharacterized protein n=1 Tax=Entomophthora muscae TaxID=34485 RepID=A0ACC2UI91_9FUNG|nr:hypothetical protein DSO57_1003447 [Entomophthora muscae]